MTSPLNATMSEADLQATIVAAAKNHKYLVYHTFDSRRSPEGFPDLICLNPRNGTMLVYELKTVKGPIRPMQREWIEAFAGAIVINSRFVRPDDLDDVLRELGECA